MKKKALGKGLKAFIPEEYGILKEERFAYLEIEKLKPNPDQPRQNFDSHSINELSQSIKESGVLQPVVVVPEEGYYKIILGERRWRAAQKLGIEKIPALIRKLPMQKQLEASLIENLQREDLNPIEIANAYKKLTQELSYTQQELAERVGVDRTSVTNFLRLLKLPKEIQDKLADNKLTMGHARALISLENSEFQISLSRQIIKKNLSVREVERRIHKMKKKAPPKKKDSFDPDLMALKESLIKSLGTKVAISGNRKKGIIKLFYFSMDDLNRLYERIKGANT
jgi:ParB family chromosome partitioning protein